MPRPRHPGLTEKEFEVMQVLWEKSPLKVAEILEILNRTPRPAYTSLLTLVQTMEKKGYIKHKKQGKAFAYIPILQEEKFLFSEVKRLAKQLFGGSPGKLVLNLVEHEQLSEAEIATLKQLLQE